MTPLHPVWECFGSWRTLIEASKASARAARKKAAFDRRWARTTGGRP